MKKIMSFLLVIGVVLGVFSGCAKKVDYDELKKNDGLMFVVRNYNCGEVSDTDDYWASTTYSIYYDGTIENENEHHLSGLSKIEATLSDDDYKTIYKFASEESKSNKFDGIEVPACDGDGWSFTYYDTDGNETRIYSGYTYGIEELKEIQDIVSGYVLE